MPSADQPHVAYVLKMYPRFSETFIVNEILAHEEGGLPLEIFSLRPPADGRFHEALAAVRAPVTYLPSSGLRGQMVWETLADVHADLPGLGTHLGALLRADVRDALQAVILAAAVRKRGVTHLHAHFGSVATTVARLAAAVAGIRYSFTAHAKDIYHDEVDRDDLRAKLAGARAVATVSDYNLAHLRAEFAGAAARVTRVYNGLDLDRFAYVTPLRRPARIVAVGRLVEKKGFADLVDACALLATEGAEVHCDIIGSGVEEDALAARIAAAGVADRVRLLGALPQSAVVARIRSAAVLAVPCVVAADGNRDGLPTVILEAMALGTPVVATDVTGIPEAVRDGETGLLVGQHDPAELAGALRRLIGDPAMRVSLAERARALVERDFDVRRQAARLRRGVFGVADGSSGDVAPELVAAREAVTV